MMMWFQMNHSKILVSFFVISIFSLLFFSNYAYGAVVSSLQESDEVCSEISAVTTILNVTDVTDFDFEQDEDYLVIVASKFGGQSGVNQLVLRLMHNATTFQGSELNYEPTITNVACVDNDNLHNYFWFTVWTPNATEATQDLVFQIDSPTGTDMQIDDSTLSIIHLSEFLTKDVDYFFDEVLTTETITTGFATPNNATITFTPSNNNDDWMILGTNQIDTGSATVNYESRIFFNGTISDFPLQSEEGEDITNELYVQTMSRFVTIPNSTAQQIEMQTQIDSAIGGTHERLYSSIFALNLDKFREHTGEFIEAEADLGDTLFVTNIQNQTLVVPINNTDIFILSDIGSKDMGASNAMFARVQLNDTDVLTGMTSEEYQFNNERDSTDIFRWSTPSIENVVNATHIVDVDGSEFLPAQDGETIYSNLIIFSLVVPVGVNNSPAIDDQFSWVDDIRLDLVKNFTDPMSMPDDIRLDSVKNFTDPMSMLDDTEINLSRNFTDPFSWVDDIRLDLVKNFTDPMSMPDEIDPMITLNFTDPMSMVDDTRLDLSKNFTDPMSWLDDIRLDLVKNFTDPMSMPDEALTMITVNFTDPMSWLDDIEINLSRNFTDPMSMVDDTRLNLTKNFTDPMSWVDDIRLDLVKNFTDPMSMLDQADTTIGFNFTDPMSMLDDTRLDIVNTDDDPMSWLDDIRIDVVIGFDDPISMPDDAQPTIGIFFDDPMSWLDSIDTKLVKPPIIVIVPPPDVTVGGGAVGGGTPVPTIPDTDGDGFLDNEDDCPTEAEIFNNFQDSDGCPDSLEQPEPLTVFDLGFPFGFNELQVVDDFINLETDSPQPQVEDLGIRWLGDEPITITSIDVGNSPFEILFEDLPVEFGNNQFGYTQEQVIFTVQEPNQVCTTTFSFDCVDDVTYEIPVVITGEVRGKTVIADGSLTIDNSNRFNPYWLVLLFLAGVPIFAFFYWRMKKKANPTAKVQLKLSPAKRTVKIELERPKELKAGSTRKILSESPSTNVLGKKTK